MRGMVGSSLPDAHLFSVGKSTVFFDTQRAAFEKEAVTQTIIKDDKEGI